jgi:hypothetical protein
MREALRLDCLAEYAIYCPDALFAPGSTRTIEDALQCAEAWPTLSCSQFDRDVSPACARPGTLAGEQPCLFSPQCESGSCTAFGEACGVCYAVAREGEACGTTKCEHGTFCDSANGYVCAVLPPEDDVPATAFIPELGQPCDPSIGCGGETRGQCARDPTHGDYTCQPWPMLGESCSSPRQCQYGDSYCADDMTCKALPGDGQACAGGRDHVCGPDQTCDTAAVVCRDLPRAGELCENVCATGLLCRCDEGGCAQRHCWRLRTAGEPCSDPADFCLPLATRCEAGVCVEVGMQDLFEAKCGM